ncbi:hypothetical protein H4R24_002096 [Coemansia sp. RSA 988]|nr:hypothetical protein H4R24_002096 [Coemansia sp. RSA 988]
MENETRAKRARIAGSSDIQQNITQTPPPTQHGPVGHVALSSTLSRVRGARVSPDARFEEIWDDKAICNVDKTLACKRFWDECSRVCRLCLPRRCGKTYTINVLHLFFSSGLDYQSVQNVPVVTEGPEADVDENASIQDICRAKKRRLFKGSLLEQLHPEFFNKHFAKYPDVKGDNLDRFISLLLYALLDMAASWLSELQMNGEDDSPIIAEDVAYFKNEILANLTPEDTFRRLSRIASELRGKKYILLVEEYDAPIIQIHRSNWDSQTKEMALNNIRLLYSIMTKDNDNLCKGLLTGVFRVSLVDLGSGANNIGEFDTVRVKPMFTSSSAEGRAMGAAASTDVSMAPTFAGMYLFNEDEVSGLVTHAIKNIPALGQYEANIMHILRDWYNGYVVGGFTGRFNPWSVLSFINSIGTTYYLPPVLECDDMMAKEYWVETGSHTIIIKELLRDRAGYIPVLSSLLTDYTTHCGQISEDNSVISTDKNMSVTFSLCTTSFPVSGSQFTLDQLLTLCLDAGYLVMRSQTTIGIPDGELFRLWHQFHAKLVFGEQSAENAIQYLMRGKILKELWSDKTTHLKQCIELSHSSLANRSCSENDFRNHFAVAMQAIALFGALTPSSQSESCPYGKVAFTKANTGTGHLDYAMILANPDTGRSNELGVIVKFRLIPSSDLDDTDIKERLAQQALDQIDSRRYAQALPSCIRVVKIGCAIGMGIFHAKVQLMVRDNSGSQWRLLSNSS